MSNDEASEANAKECSVEQEEGGCLEDEARWARSSVLSLSLSSSCIGGQERVRGEEEWPGRELNRQNARSGRMCAWQVW